jgi:hypothetical protein
MPDDYDGTGLPSDSGVASTTTTVGTGPTQALAGSWISEGDDLPPLFAAPPFEYSRIEADFHPDGSYLVTSFDQAGTATPLNGAYTHDASTDPATIVLNQQQPYLAEAQGIYQVSSNILRYEVVQVVPDYGFGPPTPSSGFGSSTGPGLSAGDNVATYRPL